MHQSPEGDKYVILILFIVIVWVFSLTFCPQRSSTWGTAPWTVPPSISMGWGGQVSTLWCRYWRACLWRFTVTWIQTVSPRNMIWAKTKKVWRNESLIGIKTASSSKYASFLQEFGWIIQFFSALWHFFFLFAFRWWLERDPTATWRLSELWPQLEGLQGWIWWLAFRVLVGQQPHPRPDHPGRLQPPNWPGGLEQPAQTHPLSEL